MLKIGGFARSISGGRRACLAIAVCVLIKVFSSVRVSEDLIRLVDHVENNFHSCRLVFVRVVQKTQAIIGFLHLPHGVRLCGEGLHGEVQAPWSPSM